MPSLSEPPRSPMSEGPEWRQWFTRVWRSLAPTDYFYIPTVAGAPTGVPEARAGFVPMVYDTTNENLYVYNGAWVKVTLA